MKEPDDSPESKPRSAVRPLIALLALLVVMLTSGRDQLREITWDLRLERWKAECQSSGEQEACGRWAIDLVIDGDVEGMRQGLALFDKLCDEKLVHRACWYAADLRAEPWVFEMLGGDTRLARQRRDALEALRRREPHGFLLAAGLGERLTKEDVESTRDACEAGSGDACFAWSLMRPSAESWRAACDAGFAGQCDAGVARSCLDGDFKACDRAEDPLSRRLAVLQTVDHRNGALHGATVPPGELGEQCEAGSAAACFALGLNVTADLDPTTSDALPLSSMELTFGRACELGANVACLVFALRLVDRPSDEHVPRARELLDAACSRGHVDSCWLVASHFLELPRELERFRGHAREMCRAQWGRGTPPAPSCAEWTRSSYEDGPWLVLDREAFRRARFGCSEASAPEACHRAGWLVAWRSGRGAGTPPLVAEGLRLSRKGCERGSADSCRVWFRLAEVGQTFGTETPDELRARVCPQMPAACSEGAD